MGKAGRSAAGKLKETANHWGRAAKSTFLRRSDRARSEPRKTQDIVKECTCTYKPQLAAAGSASAGSMSSRFDYDDDVAAKKLFAFGDQRT